MLGALTFVFELFFLSIVIVVLALAVITATILLVRWVEKKFFGGNFDEF